MADCSISIVIPAYNVEKYLNEALGSIKEQSECPDEVILIDDGSTDQTLQIAESYSFSFPYRVVSIKNSGQGNARNMGASLASSEYIYYFDSDDLLAEDFIKTIKEQLEHSDYPDIILFSGESFNDREYFGDRWTDYNRGFTGIYLDRIVFLDKGFLSKGLFCSACLYVSKKSLWGDEGLRFGNDYFEDEAIFYPLLFSCQSFCVLDKVFFYRRNRNDSLMTMKRNSNHVKGALNCMENTMKLYRSGHFSKREQWHIKKQLKNHCNSYIAMAKATGLKISYKKIFNAIVATRNITLATKAFRYAVGLKVLNRFKKSTSE
jgi:glycosyltransferase involved in cell wall biosynthesis